jgi:hypothetical protein
MVPLVQLIIGAFTFACIFMYRRRVRQKRFCIGVGVAQLLYQALGMLADDCGGVSWLLTLPAICAILLFAAARYIAKDEAFVRSQDRLRL